MNTLWLFKICSGGLEVLGRGGPGGPVTVLRKKSKSTTWNPAGVPARTSLGLVNAWLTAVTVLPGVTVPCATGVTGRNAACRAGLGGSDEAAAVVAV